MADITPWINLYSCYVGIYSSADDDRAFKAFAGVVPQVAEYIFLKYQHVENLATRTDLFIVLHFLKVYPTEDNASRTFQFKSRTTYRTKLWRTLSYLDVVMDEVSLHLCCIYFP